MIRAIVFDWGGVLVVNTVSQMILSAADHLGVAYEKLTGEMRQHLVSDFSKGIISEDEFWGHICDAMSVGRPRVPSLWKQVMMTYYVEQQDVFDLVTRLKTTGYKIGLLSNTEMPVVELFDELGYNQFDATIFSCKEGVCKPDRKMYQIACQRLDVQPRETVFIDDKEENVRGARNAGLHAILFVSPEQIRKELALIIAKEND